MNWKNIVALVLTVAIAIAAFGFAAKAEVGAEYYSEFYGIEYRYETAKKDFYANKTMVLLMPMSKIIAYMDEGSNMYEYYIYENGNDWGMVATAIMIEAANGYVFAIQDYEGNINQYDMTDAEDILTAVSEITNWIYAYGYVNGQNNGTV